MKSRIEIMKLYFRRENGAAEIIAVIVLVAIVIILAIAFREQIGEFLSNIWSAISGRGSEITSDLEL